MITSNANEKIKRFNNIGLHYNLVADSVYKFRNSFRDPFSVEYFPYVIAALVSFDMGRMMGPDARSRYNRDAGGFATTLEKKLKAIKPLVNHLINLRLTTISISNERENISNAYCELAASGKDGLNQRGGEFHVGATKILHFINPDTFLIVDSNAARAFRSIHRINFRNTTQPGYSAEKYIACMTYAQKDILDYGVEDFCALDRAVPIARIYDKLTFISGSNMP